MSIVSSTHRLDGHAQRDGSIYVTEDHVDEFGKHYVFEYLAAPGTDYVAVRAQRAARIAAWQVDNEIAELLAADAAPTLRFATKAQLAARIRENFRAATAVDAARLATWLLNRIDGGAFTAAEVRAAFGVTAAQWTNTLQPKLDQLRAHYNAVMAAAGE